MTPARSVTPAFDPTAEQRDAIGAPLSAQLLVAGAGTGKTTVMAQRILHLVGSGQARAEQILGLTFTNKAAANLKRKVREALGDEADATIATYHSFGASLVADHALELDLAPGTRVLNRAQSWQLLFAVFDDFRFERRGTFSPQLLLNDALTLASRCADHLVTVEALEADCRHVAAHGRWANMKDRAAVRLELCQVISAYHRRKRERALIDYDDQVGLAVRLLSDNPDVAAAYRQQYPVVLLDEYQDTNYAQRRLLQLIYPPGSAVTAVGDDMQSIYAFRGAHLLNILRFPDHFAPVTSRPLQVTFRFGTGLVALANRIQAQVAESLPKELRPSQHSPATTIECFLAADDAAEAATIATDVAGTGPPWSEIAVLCRKRRLIRPIAAALEERGIPVEVVGDSGLLDRPEVVDLVAWLELLADRTASVALLRILQGPRYNVDRRDLAALARRAREIRDTKEAAASPDATTPEATDAAGTGGGDDRRSRHDRPPVLADAIDDLASVTDLTPEARWRLDRFAGELAALRASSLRLPVLDLAETVISRTGLWRAAGERGRENLLRFLDLAEDFSPVEGDPGLAAFVEYLRLLDESEEDLAESHLNDTDSVRVMTIHQAKGLEFDTVFVPGLAGSRGTSRIFPDSRSGENALTNTSALPWWLREDEGIPSPATATQAEIDEVIRRRKLDEEWRLLYVACTRARRRLVCSAAHWYPGPAEPQGPSRFYEFVAAQTDLVSERFRHEPAEVDPDIAARQRQQQEVARYSGSVAPTADTAAAGAGSKPVQPPLDESLSAVPPAPARTAPTALSVTGLVAYARCPKQFYWMVVRPLPRRSSPASRLGTEVHRWIEQRAGRQLSLIEPDDGSDIADGGAAPSEPGTAVAAGAGVAERLKACFLASPWAALDPLRVEAPFALAVERHLVRGRVDAVYERDGMVELVDFKTGRPHDPADPSAGTQLELYGLAAIDTWGTDPSTLRTTYCYLRTDGPAEVRTRAWDKTEVDSTRARLAATLDRLAAARFGATPGSWCHGCDFVSFCGPGRRQTGRYSS